jgi:hypothetical protein
MVYARLNHVGIYICVKVGYSSAWCEDMEKHGIGIWSLQFYHAYKGTESQAWCFIGQHRMSTRELEAKKLLIS